MESVSWKVEGMTCSNCALTISNFVEKSGGTHVRINAINGELDFDLKDANKLTSIKKGIEDLGYTLFREEKNTTVKTGWLSNNKKRFLFTLPFALMLMWHMFDHWIHIHWLMNPYVQLFICLPVFFTGLWFFGRSAWKSLRNGMPNMNTLISIGALASFFYSLSGLLMGFGSQYLFFETTATIICLVFMGNYLEELSVASTQRAVKKLMTSQRVTAHLIAFDDKHREVILPIDNSHLKTGDLVLIKTGEKVPADVKILWGEASVNESLLTGESQPVFKKGKDLLIGGSVLDSGVVKAQVTAAGDETVLAGILRLVKQAQMEKPPLQKMADKISAVFVPIVIALALLTFFLNIFFWHQDISHAIMRAVAVLVIACPCAMGIATPAGIAVGLGRAARSGILFKKPSAMESFKKIDTIVFDKTGTLTTGKFSIHQFQTSLEEAEFKRICYSLEKYASHPMAKAISDAWSIPDSIRWKHIEEIKGSGLKAEDYNGNKYLIGSKEFVLDTPETDAHSILVSCNENLIGWLDLKDEVRPEARSIIDWLCRKKIHTILLSGDRREKCEQVANQLGIQDVFSGQSPSDKLNIISKLSSTQVVAMVGDGINDSPALAKASLGISLSEASQIAMQHADVILVGNGLKNLPLAIGLGRHTYSTIQQNLFWAFFYNLLAIPIAAIGLLTPGLAALAMGFSDVILAANSVRLFVKKVV